MAVCNIFKRLTKSTGTFLTFSTYAESLTKTSQKVIPSKFVALDISGHDLTNDQIPKILQDYYENGLAAIKNDIFISKDATIWDERYSKDLFWRTMLEHFISNEDIKYIGDINIQSHEEYGGTGYTEIYCYIPNEASRYEYRFEIPQGGNIISSRPAGSFVEGYGDDDGIGIWGKLEDPIDYILSDLSAFNDDDSIWCDDLGVYGEYTDSSYNINSVVVLYDIIDENTNKVIQTNQPMGIFFTGLWDENNQTITNSITKYVSDPNIYGAGTSYGLRICTKYISTSDSAKITEFAVNHDSKSELSYALSQMSQSQTKMDELVDHTYNCIQNYKDLVSIFRNSRTNVPYIKLINGKEYWFVNGKRVGNATIDDGELDHVCGITLEAKLYNENGIGEIKALSIKDLYTGTALRLKWTIKNGDVLLSSKEINKIELISPNNELSDLGVNSDNYTIISLSRYNPDSSHNQQILIYQLKVTLADGQTVTENVPLVITMPSYIGLIKCDADELKSCVRPVNGNNMYTDKLSDLINGLSIWGGKWLGGKPTELVLENQEYIYKYTNTGYTDNSGFSRPYHICYIIPALNTNESRFSNITTYKPLSSIKDSRDLEYINDFELVSANGNNTCIMNIGGSSVLYNIYIDKIPAYVQNYTMSFK